jgi:plasmid maintenance system antidote protein VapI
MLYKVGRCLLEDILESKRLERSYLTDKLHMSRQQINDYISHRRVMTLRTAKNIAEVLNVTIEELYEFEQASR